MSDPRRKTKRRQARWKAALAFHGVANKPIFHTLTHDLSLNGTSVQSKTDEAAGTLLTLLLAPPEIQAMPQKIIRLKAVVMSSTPFRSGFRLGLSFVYDDELARLRNLLERLDLSGESIPSEPYELESGEAVSAVAERVDEGGKPDEPQMSILDVLKQKNLSKKLADERLAKDKLERQQILHKRISDTLMVAYRYFTELVEQLNSLKPDYPATYTLVNVADFSGLVWQANARTNCLTRKLESDDKIFNKVTLDYTLARPQEIQVVREYHVHQKAKLALEESGVPYIMTLSKNNRGLVDSAVFLISCEVKARLAFTCDDETGRLRLSTRNVERFGTTEYEFEIEMLNRDLLDQLTLMILGEKHHVGKLIKFAMPKPSPRAGEHHHGAGQGI